MIYNIIDMKLSVRYYIQCKDGRDVAQLGSAPRLGRGGRWFESSHPDFKRIKYRRV